MDVEERVDGFGERQGEGPDENHHLDLLSRHSLPLNIRFALQPWVIRHHADSRRLPIKDIATIRLWQKEEQKDKAEAGQPHLLLYRPCQIHIL